MYTHIIHKHLQISNKIQISIISKFQFKRSLKTERTSIPDRAFVPVSLKCLDSSGQSDLSCASPAPLRRLRSSGWDDYSPLPEISLQRDNSLCLAWEQARAPAYSRLLDTTASNKLFACFSSIIGLLMATFSSIVNTNKFSTDNTSRCVCCTRTHEK